jgi:inorganic pyrophosphatase
MAKLSQKDIAIIEHLLSLAERDLTLKEISDFLHLGEHGMQRISQTFTTLKRIGVTVPDRETRAMRMKREFAEFREWKRKRETVSTLHRGSGMASHG